MSQCRSILVQHIGMYLPLPYRMWLRNQSLITSATSLVAWHEIDTGTRLPRNVKWLTLKGHDINLPENLFAAKIDYRRINNRRCNSDTAVCLSVFNRTRNSEGNF
jgi:hypothetical protein